jgi:NMD protein affecting ribosome stability and mRNA decay
MDARGERKVMARTCVNCGHKVRVADKYCSECGVPLGTIAAPTQAQEWEYCEVTWSARGFLANDKSYFWAQDMLTGDEVMRSQGTFQAREVTETNPYPAGERRTHIVIGELIEHLKDEGWEPMATGGSGWWSQRFKRKIVG